MQRRGGGGSRSDAGRAGERSVIQAGLQARPGARLSLRRSHMQSYAQTATRCSPQVQAQLQARCWALLWGGMVGRSRHCPGGAHLKKTAAPVPTNTNSAMPLRYKGQEHAPGTGERRWAGTQRAFRNGIAGCSGGGKGSGGRASAPVGGGQL